MKNLARLLLVVLAATALLFGQWGSAFAQSQADGAQNLSFDHNTTGYILDNTHIRVNCETCHTSGVFRGTPRACATCHAGPGARAPGKPATHIPTTAACDSCHRAGATNWGEKPTGFITGASGHGINPQLGVTTSNCQTCHNGAFLGANALAKPASHMQTNSACSACHGTTSWLPASTLHVGVQPGTCATCHNGVKAPGKNGDHIPTANACDTCHKNFISFAPAMMNHTGVAGQCSTCHSGRYVLQNARGMQTATHIPTNGIQCDNCHLSTASWFVNFDHSTIAANAACETCHGRSATTSAVHQSNGHIPNAALAGVPCSNCHKNFVTFKPAQMDHTGVGACSACHNGAYVSANALAKPKGSHITTSLECNSCHTAGFVNWSPATMNHTGLGGQCKSCHSGGYISQNAQTMTSTHIATNNAQCDTCHGSTTTWATGFFDHATANPPATGRCSSCHNGKGALGLSINHIPTTGQCDNCHKSFTAFSSVTMSHAGTAGTCRSCHNGGYKYANALGVIDGHIPTLAQCDTCHTGGFTTWSPGVMNHTGLSGQCSTCHNGGFVSQKALEKPLTHVATNAQCDTCHNSTTTWATGKYTHDPVAVTGRCTNCHAPGKGALSAIPGVHIPTAAQCDTCHKNFNAFKPVALAEMDHSNVGTGGAACSTCHDGRFVSQNALDKPKTHIQTTGACNDCHGTGNGYTSWTSGSFNHTAATPSVLRRCASCHNGVTALSKSAVHIPVPPTSSCEDCHGTTYTSFKGAKMNHALTSEACTNCHNGSYVQQGAQEAKAGYHIPVSVACTTCHGNGNGYTSWSPAAMDHTGQTACSTCHGGTYVRQNAQAKPITHQATNANAQCSDCHTLTTSWRVGAVQNHALLSPPAVMGDHSCNGCHNGTAGKGLSKPGGHIPTTGFCDTCHTNFNAFAPAAMSHAGITSGCLSCHGGGFVTVKAQAMSQQTHLPTTAPCENCHVVASSFKPATMNHALSNGQCSNCHGGGFVPLRAFAKPGNHVSTTAQCDICHTSTTVWTGAKYPHAGANGLCSNCHGSGGVVTVLGANPKSLTHTATTAQCDTCHKSTTVWTGAAYTHAASAVGTCSNCHNVAVLAPAHIPTTRQCDNCHKSYAGFKTSVIMSHAATAGSCYSCHNGNASYVSVRAEAKNPTTHIPTTPANQSCDACHGTSVWKPATNFHVGVVPGTCVNCHNGTKATGKNQSTHILTALACDTCHRITDAHFTPAQMNHTGTTGQCSSCHSGGFRGLTKPGTHVGTSAQCDTCHTSTTVWTGAKYPHTATAGICSNCHGSNGVTTVLGANPKSATHLATTAQCDTCHKSTTSWLGAVFAHSATAAGTCKNCHNGLTAKGKPAGAAHIPTTSQCDTCHKNYNGFTSWTMNHTGTTGQCLTCHNATYAPIGAVAKTTPRHSLINDSCDVCHTTTAWSPTTFSHSAAQVGTKTCANCHNGTTATGKSVPHILTSEGCGVCHRMGSGWKPIITPYAHTGVAAGSCKSCHVSSYPGLTYQPVTNHVPTTASCDACHLKTSWTTLGAYNHVGATNCLSCHTGTYVGVKGKNFSPKHVPTTLPGMLGDQCSLCHTGTTSFVTVSKLNHGSMQTGCKTCHNNPTSYDVGTADKKTLGNHEGSKAADDCSKSGCHRPLGNRGTAYSKW